MQSPDCEIQYLRDKQREEVSLVTFAQDLCLATADIIYEMYGQNCAHLEGILTKDGGWKTFEMNVFFDTFRIVYQPGHPLF